MSMPDMVMTGTTTPTPVAMPINTAKNSGMSVVQDGITPERTGYYTGMTTLSSMKVQSQGISLLWECDVPGDYRGSEHQPLVVANVLQKDGTTCSVLLATTMSNDVYCFDYDKPDPANPSKGRLIWKQRIGNPVNMTQYDVNGSWKNPYDMYPINRPFWGSLSCPYIDENTMTMYVCNASSMDGTMPKVRYYLHALDLTTGVDKCPPLDISTAVFNSPGGPIAHDASPRKQRAGLAFHSYNNGTQDIIFVCDSTFAMMANSAHGFITACDVTGVRNNQPMKIAACTTMSAPPYAGAGVWMAGGAPVVTPEGKLIVVMANGAFDPTKHCFGNATAKVSLVVNSSGYSLVVEDWICFYTDCGRAGFDPTSPWIGLHGNYAGQIDGMSMTAPDDQDLGCAGAPYLDKAITGFTDNLTTPCGKDGIAYIINADNMGKTQVTDFAPDKIQANYAKALAITGATYFPGNFNITPTDLGKMATTVGGYTHHQHCRPAWFMSPDHGLLMFFGGENGAIRVFNISQDATTKKYSWNFIGESAEVASAGLPAPGGMPGTMLSISSVNGEKDTAILWAIQPVGDGNKEITRWRVLAYGANWFNNGQLIKIWDSETWGSLQDGTPWARAYCKFAKPCPALDKVVLPTYEAKLLVIG